MGWADIRLPPPTCVRPKPDARIAPGHGQGKRLPVALYPREVWHRSVWGAHPPGTAQHACLRGEPAVPSSMEGSMVHLSRAKHFFAPPPLPVIFSFFLFNSANGALKGRHGWGCMSGASRPKPSWWVWQRSSRSSFWNGRAGSGPLVNI